VRGARLRYALLMPGCELCGAAPIAHVSYLGGRAERRVWLCAACHLRCDEHDLDPEELLALARRVAQRTGKCDWCAAEPPAAQVRVPAGDGRLLAFHLCAGCARLAHRESGGKILHGDPARSGEVTIDPRYERAREIAKRRKQIRRVK
jgi:hypothetical protein